MKRLVSVLSALLVATIAAGALTALAPAPGRAEAVSRQARPLRITGVTTDCECGGAYMSVGDARWSATMIRFHGREHDAAHIYKLSVRPRLRVSKSLLRTRLYVHSGFFGLMHGGRDFKKGRHYVLQIREYAHGRLVRTSARVRWTPRVVQHPASVRLLDPATSTTPSTITAGHSYRIAFSGGSFDPRATVYVQVLAHGAGDWGYPADSEILVKAFRSPHAIDFTVPDWVGGDVLDVVALAHRAGRLDKSWGFGGVRPIVSPTG